METTQIILTTNDETSDLALNEVRRYEPRVKLLHEPTPGVLRLTLEQSFAALSERLQAQPPIFIRHICPVQYALPLQGTRADIDVILTAIRGGIAEALLAEVDPSLPFSIQTRILSEGLQKPLDYQPFDLNTPLSALIQETTGAVLNVRQPQQIVSIVIGTGRHDEPALIASIGLSLVAQNLSDWAGGARRFSRDAEQVSRAEFKLLEALETFHITLSPRGTALDLGAAPGGWTRVLRSAGLYVTAIDPAALHPRVADDTGVRYRPLTAELYLDDDADEFDCILNDIHMDARDSARLMVNYARILRPEGFALMTLKLPHAGQRDVIDYSMDILSRRYTIRGARQLFHNRSEITVYLGLRDAQGKSHQEAHQQSVRSTRH